MPLVPTSGPDVIAVINLKGGAGKSTAAGYVCSALSERGWPVLGVDTDRPQYSLSKWHKAIAPTWDCIQLPESDLDARLPGIYGSRYRAVVIDSPPTEGNRGIALAAAQAATHVLVPVAPSTVEFAGLPDTRELLDEATELGAEFEHGLLIIKWRAGASSGPHYTNRGIREGWHVLRAHVPLWEVYAQAVMMPIERARATGYGWAVAELLGLED